MASNDEFGVVDLDVLRGKKPLMAQQVKVLRRARPRKRGTQVEQCLGAINRRLIGGDSNGAFGFSCIMINGFEPKVVEQAIDIMISEGGYREVKIVKYNPKSKNCFIDVY